MGDTAAVREYREVPYWHNVAVKYADVSISRCFASSGPEGPICALNRDHVHWAALCSSRFFHSSMSVFSLRESFDRVT